MGQPRQSRPAVSRKVGDQPVVFSHGVDDAERGGLLALAGAVGAHAALPLEHEAAFVQPAGGQHGLVEPLEVSLIELGFEGFVD
jgi:hypothetical protein